MGEKHTPIRRLLGMATLAGLVGVLARWAIAAGKDRGLDDHYLAACVGDYVDHRGRKSLRHFHWNPEDFPLSVYVPLPPGMPAAVAEECRRAVLAGIRAWQDRVPDLIHLQFVSDVSQAPIAPVWVDHFATDVGGRCFYAVTVDGEGNVTMGITTFELATHTSPRAKRPRVPYTPKELQRTATHEMGHALGLGHSRRPSDIMYPDFHEAGWFISERDVRTLRRLYTLPNGAIAR